MIRNDLHVHSVKSMCGMHTLLEIVEIAAEKGMRMVNISDHAPTEKHGVTATVMDRLEDEVDAQTCREILSSSLRHLENEWFTAQRDAYLESGSLDAYLDRKGKEFLAELERIRDEGRLFFTQPRRINFCALCHFATVPYSVPCW